MTQNTLGSRRGKAILAMIREILLKNREKKLPRVNEGPETDPIILPCELTAIQNGVVAALPDLV
jgi:hypothetical protein